MTRATTLRQPQGRPERCRGTSRERRASSRALAALSLATSLFLAATAQAASPQTGIEAQVHREPVAPEIPAAVAAALAPGGVRAVVGGATLDFWWVKGLKANAGSAAASWADIEEGSLIGAVRLSADFRDIRGRVIRAGLFTLRFGIQPDNGDHLGTSPFREFLLLSPAAADTDPAPRGHQGTIDISKQAIGGSHPAVWSIDPPAAAEGVLAPHTTELGHRAIIMEVPIVRDGKPAGALRFGVVLVGRIDA